MSKDEGRKPGNGAMARIEALCQKRGVRMTEPRRAIARLLSSTDDHPGVDELHDRLRELGGTISKATIYRTLTMFEEAGIVSRRDFGDGRARFEPTSSGEDHHHHMVDIETGEVVEFFDQELEDLKEQIARDLGFQLVDHRLELFGVRRRKKH